MVANKIGNAIKIGRGNLSCTRVMRGGEQLWPTTLYATLEPEYVSWNTIPATGGIVTFMWKYKVYLNGVLQSTDYVSTPASVSVTRTGTDVFSMSFSGSVVSVSAPNRGTNGYTTGTTAPTSDQLAGSARSSNFTAASYQLTYQGQTVTASLTSSFSASQAANPASHQSASDTYDQFGVYVDAASSSSSPLPAGRTDTAAHPSCRLGNYYLWATNQSAYWYQTFDTPSAFDITSSQSWVTVGSTSSTGTAITVATRGTTTGDQRSATLTAKLKSTYGVQTTATTTIYQRENRIDQSKHRDAYNTINNFYLNAVSNIPVGGATVSLTGYWSGTTTSAYDEYYSGAHTGGETTTVSHSSNVSPDYYKIGYSGSWVSGASWTVGSNRYTTYSQTFYVYGKYQGKETSSSITVTQDGDTYTSENKVDYYATISQTSGSWTAGPNQSSVTLTWSAYHETYTVTTWSDGTPRSESAHVRYTDSINPTLDTSASTASGASGRISRNGYNITHTTMGTNEGYDRVRVTLTNQTASNYVDIEVQNQRYEGTVVEGEKQYGTATVEYRNWSFSTSLDAYDSQAGAAPKTSGSTTLRVTASHQERTASPWTRTRTRTDTYDSGATNTVTLEPSTGTDYTEWGSVSDLGRITTSIDGTGFTLGTFNTTTGTQTVNIAANTGNARSALISVTRAAYGGQSATTKYEHIYQRAGNIAISVSVSELTFTKYGGTQTFTVTATSSGWTRTYYKADTSSYNPFTGGSVTPSSGNAGTTTITVQIAQHTSSIYGTEHRIGFITFTADEDPDVTATVRVDQYPAVGDGN